mmetsp:Transcript_98898/g.262661  ORF Transcript_98898/g.262661 Transcript_98898/m.262661 type:complete len:243 (-) Transcript_98898:16-744(-)
MALLGNAIPNPEVAHEAADHAGRTEVPRCPGGLLFELLIRHGLPQRGGEALSGDAVRCQLLLARLPALHGLVEVHDPDRRRGRCPSLGFRGGWLPGAPAARARGRPPRNGGCQSRCKACERCGVRELPCIGVPAGTCEGWGTAQRRVTNSRGVGGNAQCPPRQPSCERQVSLDRRWGGIREAIHSCQPRRRRHGYTNEGGTARTTQRRHWSHSDQINYRGASMHMAGQPKRCVTLGAQAGQR